MFREGHGSDVVWGVADYWVSRVSWNPEDQHYHIRGLFRGIIHFKDVLKGFGSLSACACVSTRSDAS